MKKGKQQLLILSAAVILASTVLGTLAYFTDTTDVVVNTFTVGKVGITLTETGDGTPNTQGGQEYDLIPGLTYEKKPAVTVNSDSEEAYVRMLATVTYQETADEVFTKYPVEKWLDIKDVCWRVNGAPVTIKKDGTISRTYEFRYQATVNNESGPEKDGVLEPLFTKVTIPGEVDNAEMATLQGLQISVVAHAIQAAGFENADEAWAAFGAQEGK